MCQFKYGTYCPPPRAPCRRHTAMAALRRIGSERFEWWPPAMLWVKPSTTFYKNHINTVTVQRVRGYLHADQRAGELQAMQSCEFFTCAWLNPCDLEENVQVYHKTLNLLISLPSRLRKSEYYADWQAHLGRGSQLIFCVFAGRCENSYNAIRHQLNSLHGNQLIQ